MHQVNLSFPFQIYLCNDFYVGMLTHSLKDFHFGEKLFFKAKCMN